MTREEAIAKFEKQLTSAMVVLDSGFGTRPGESDRLYRERKELAEIALSALRAQQELESKLIVLESSDMFDEDGVEILNDETVTDRHQMTNADRIRAMNDEELVNVVPCPLGFSMFRCPIERQCGPCKREWLQQPAEEADNV